MVRCPTGGSDNTEDLLKENVIKILLIPIQLGMLGFMLPNLNIPCHFVLLCNLNKPDLHKHLYNIAATAINIFCHSRRVSM